MKHSWRLFLVENTTERVERAAERRPVAAPERVAHRVVQRSHRRTGVARRLRQTRYAARCGARWNHRSRRVSNDDRDAIQHRNTLRPPVVVGLEKPDPRSQRHETHTPVREWTIARHVSRAVEGA